MLSNSTYSHRKIAPRQEKTFDKIENSLINSSPVDRDVLHCLKNTSDRLRINEISQTRIANLTGHSYSAVNKSVARLTKKKLISKKTRFKKTCIYTVNKFFYEKDNWRRLLYLFKKARPQLNPILLRYKDITNRKNLECQQRYSKFVSYKFLVSLFKKQSRCFLEKDYLQVHRESYNEASHARARDPRMRARHIADFEKKREEIVEHAKTMFESMMNPTLRELTKILNLSKWGQMTLVIFPELVLKQSLQDFRRARNVKNPFGFVFSRCKQYCKEHDIEIPWKAFYTIRDAYRMPENAPMTLQREAASEVKKDTRPVKSHPLLEKSYPVRTQAPKEDPYEVIRAWEEWVASPIFPKASAIAGPVSPFVTNIIIEKEVPDAEIERLYAKYPFLKAHMDEVIARRLANPERADYTGSVREAIDTMLGVVHETVHTERRASPTPSFASAAQGDGFPQETESGLCDRFGESTRREPFLQGTFDFGS